jgi:predicted molibdopterin-dependent oxidoreductase YjgC
MHIMGNRILEHAVLDVSKTSPLVSVTVDGEKIEAYEGEMILAALLARGMRINRYTVGGHEPRGLFCGIGQCTDCAMVVDGVANVRTCVTPVRAGMVIETQDGLGAKGAAHG